jgi:DNA topoisomerase I
MRVRACWAKTRKPANRFRGEGEKPPRSSLPKGTDAEAVDLELALKLLSLPRTIGMHPETNTPITANFGRFGPYVAHDGKYASLDSPDEVFTVGINRAVTLLAERKAKGGGRRQAQALKELGAHPQSGAPIKVLKGKYGPYVSDGTTNATIPEGIEPESVTPEQAVEWLAARAGKGKPKRKGAKKAAKAKSKAADAPAKPKRKAKAA